MQQHLQELLVMTACQLIIGNKMPKGLHWDIFPTEDTPLLHWAQIRMLNKKIDNSHKVWPPFLLPHEWLSSYCHDPLAWQDLEPAANSRYATKAAEVAQQMGLPVTGIVPLGLHGDGVPIQGTLNEQTLDTFCVNMPTSKQNSSLRVPFIAILSL